jgi:hypothetical protein
MINTGQQSIFPPVKFMNPPIGQITTFYEIEHEWRLTREKEVLKQMLVGMVLS